MVTGGLGTGKTSVLSALDDAVLVVAEPARELIAEHHSSVGEGLLDTRPQLFVERLIERSITKHQSVEDGVTAIFDRGLPDCVAYAAIYGIDAQRAIEAAEEYRYEIEVFIAPPWKEIYTTDNMRRATFAQAAVFYAEVVAAYERLGYSLVELPRTSVQERAAFISARLPQEKCLEALADGSQEAGCARDHISST